MTYICSSCYVYQWKEKFKDTKGVIRSHQSNDRQCRGQFLKFLFAIFHQHQHMEFTFHNSYVFLEEFFGQSSAPDAKSSSNKVIATKLLRSSPWTGWPLWNFTSQIITYLLHFRTFFFPLSQTLPDLSTCVTGVI